MFIWGHCCAWIVTSMNGYCSWGFILGIITWNRHVVWLRRQRGICMEPVCIPETLLQLTADDIWEFCQVLHDGVGCSNLVFFFPWNAFLPQVSEVIGSWRGCSYSTSLFDGKLILEICIWALWTAAVPSHAPIFKASIADAFFVSAAIGSWEDSGGITVSHNISCSWTCWSQR